MVWIKRVHLLTLMVFAAGILCNAEDVYYVKPTEALDGSTNFDPEALCPDDPCNTLDHYVRDKYHYFTSNTRIQFLPGVHRLDMGPGESLINIRNVSNLTLTGSKVFRMVAGLKTPESVILCASRIGFLFTYTESLSINHLTIFNCGSLPYETNAFAIALFNVINTHLSHVLVSKSSGYGILGFNILGVSSITDSVVFGSQDSESYLGGNAAIYFNPSESDYHRLGNDTIHFTIQSTSFARGLVSQFGSKAGGLAIYIANPYSNSYVSLYDVSLHDNVHTTWNNDTSDGGIYIGANLLIAIFEWKCSSNYISIDRCTFHHGVAARGGGIQMVILPLGPNNTCSYTVSPPSNFIRIANSNVTSNIAYTAGGGIYVTIFHSFSRGYHWSYLQLIGIMSENNECTVSGGNAYLSSPTISDEQYKIEIRDCLFKNGKAVNPAAAGGGTGGGLSLVLLDSLLGLRSSTEVLIIETEFLSNSAGYGGGAAIYIYPVKAVLASVCIAMVNCTFGSNLGSRGSALLVRDLDYDVQLPTIQSSIGFINLSVVDNQAEYDETCLRCDSKAFEFLYAKNVTFFNANFHNNNVGAVRLYGSILILGGTIRFNNNTGFKGAGIEICTDSYIYLKQNTYVSFTNNHARYAGGAIYVKASECDLEGDGSNKCFFNIDYSYNSSSHILSQISFVNNTAVYAGTALYGGNVDNCIPSEQFQRDITEIRRGNAREIDWAPKGSQMFDSLFKFNQSDLSVISSHPVVMCLCENGHPNCSIKQIQTSAYPGETFSVLAVAVGQRDGVVPGVAIAAFAHYSDSHTLDDFQNSQNVNSTCTVLNFTIFSNSSIEDLSLRVETPDRHFIAVPPSLSITLLPCPPGFTLRGLPPRFKCDCVEELTSLGTSCDIDQGTILRPTTVWIGYYQSEISKNATSTSGILLHEHCPYDYCRPEDIDIKLDYSDEQCAFNRSGVLCGACTTGLSIVLSTSRCFDCSNRYFALILVMLLAGLVLIFILTTLDFTISDGTIGGLVFYANIVHTNKVSFFQFKTSFLSVFIAWLNFDWGIETCFYDGMDTYARTWLQFIFPLYIWGIVTFMIVSSHYSTAAAKLFGRNNSVRVLATLVLLSYTKILRTIITVLSFTTLTYPDKSVKFLWLADANLEYLTGKHIPLFLVALVFLFFSLLYTALLLFLQCLWPRSHYRLLSWIRRIKPFLDAHTGPYNDKYRFWIGLLFLARITLFMGFAVNSLGDPSLNLLFVVIMIMCILGFKWIAAGIYKNRFLDTLEASFFLNLGLLSAATSYTQSINGESKVQDIVVSTCVGVAFVIFFGISVYHTRTCLPQTAMGIKKGLFYCCTRIWKKQQTPAEANGEQEAVIEDNDNDANIPAGSYEAVSGESLAQSQAPVQCMRLTFDRQATSGEAEFELL